MCPSKSLHGGKTTQSTCLFVRSLGCTSILISNLAWHPDSSPGSPLARLTPCIVMASVKQWRWDRGRKDVAECLSINPWKKACSHTFRQCFFQKETKRPQPGISQDTTRPTNSKGSWCRTAYLMCFYKHLESDYHVLWPMYLIIQDEFSKIPQVVAPCRPVLLVSSV